MLNKLRRKYLIRNAGKVFRRAWSVRLMGLASLLLGSASVALPFVAPIIPNEYLVAFAVVLFLVVTAAGLARFFDQNIGGC